jgi:hypothetical protein
VFYFLGEYPGLLSARVTWAVTSLRFEISASHVAGPFLLYFLNVTNIKVSQIQVFYPPFIVIVNIDKFVKQSGVSFRSFIKVIC